MKKKEEAYLFQPDFTKKRFTVTVEVYDSGTVFKTTFHNGHSPTFQEMVGALTIATNGILRDHAEVSSKEYKKHTKKQQQP